MRLTLTAVLLFAAVVPAFAQKNLGKALPKAFSLQVPSVASRQAERQIARVALRTQLQEQLPGKNTVTIFHTSDVHGFFYPRNGQGGYAALASLVKREPKPSLLLDSGDFSQGSAETLVSKGLSAVRMMNAVQYDAATYGNHEFDFGNEQTIHNFKQAKFSILASNTTPIIPSDLVRPYKIFNVNNMRVAVIGLAYVQATLPLEGPNDTIELLSDMLAKIQEEHADVVVLLAHHALPNQRHMTEVDMDKISEQFAGQIHVVLGGHAHNIVQNEKRNGILFVESGTSLQYVSKVTVEKDVRTGEVQASSELIPLVIEKTGESEEVKNLAEQLRFCGIDTPLGTTAMAFEEESSCEDHLDSPINNWIADLVRAYSGAQIGAHIDHAVRNTLHQGEITERDLIEVFPFDDKVVSFPISGKSLQQFVETHLEKFTFSGLEVAYVQHENGTRQIVSIQVAGVPLDPNKVYTLAASSYIVLGKNGYKGEFTEIPESVKQIVGEKTIRMLMQEQVETRSPLVPPQTGRIHRIRY